MLGVRKNEPAKGFLFVPGGATLKGESFSDAIRRTSSSSIGIELEPENVSLLWLNEQIYPNNFTAIHSLA